MQYGVWGLIDLSHCSKRSGEKISPELELTIIEERLMYPSLTPIRIMEKLDLKCSRTNVQKIYNRWELAKFNEAISIRGVISRVQSMNDEPLIKLSAKALFPDLIQKLKNERVDLVALELTQNSKPLKDYKPKFPLALIIGNEKTGVSPKILQLADKKIFIPMQGIKESLNVSVAFGIALYRLSNDF